MPPTQKFIIFHKYIMFCVYGKWQLDNQLMSDFYQCSMYYHEIFLLKIVHVLKSTMPIMRYFLKINHVFESIIFFYGLFLQNYHESCFKTWIISNWLCFYGLFMQNNQWKYPTTINPFLWKAKNHDLRALGSQIPLNKRNNIVILKEKRKT